MTINPGWAAAALAAVAIALTITAAIHAGRQHRKENQ